MSLIGELVGKILPKNQFVRSVGVLVGGTAGAQAIVVLSSPILTRLYSPDDFSIFAVYSSIFGILVSIACLRFEIAIPLPQKDTVAINVLAISLCMPLIVGIVLCLIFFFADDLIVGLLRRDGVDRYFWLIPIGVWLAGSCRALQYWAIRKKRFRLVTKARLLQSFGGVSTQIVFGFFCIGPLGLLLGMIVRISLGILGLWRDLVTTQIETLRQVNFRDVVNVFREYKRFPKYSTMEALANSGSAELPILLIASVVTGPEVGFLMLATRVMTAPMSLIGKSVAEVYLSTAADCYRKGQLGASTLNVMRGLLKIGVGPLVFAGITAQYLFPVIFGREWSRAGEIIMWMTPWFIMQFLVSPISMVLHVVGRQTTALGLQVFGLALRFGVVFVAAFVIETRIVEAYAVSGFLFYSLYAFIICKIIGVNVFKAISFYSLLIVFFWTIIAFFLKSLLC